jgi:hypothetical protein
MSSSQLLTITESHGFRALVAAVAWIIGCWVACKLGLRNLWSNSQPARMDVVSGSRLRIFPGDVGCSHREPVLWFDIMGRRDGPPGFGLRPGYWTPTGFSYYSPVIVLAVQATPELVRNRRN